MSVTVKCPGCKKEVEWEGNAFRPFCSDRCRLLDLGKWADEEYSIAGGKAPQHDRDDELEF